MTLAILLDELAKLSHDGRMQRMVRQGELSRTDESAAAILQQMSAGDVYQRRLALAACYGSRDAGTVLNALNDESRLVRALALRLVVVVCDDAGALSALERVPNWMRRGLIVKLVRRGRHAPVDAFLQLLAAQQDPQLESLATYASPSTVEALVDLSRGGTILWSRAARSHPNMAANMLLQRLEASTQFDNRLLWNANAILPVLAEKTPHQALALVRALHRFTPLKTMRLDALLMRAPNELADIALESGDTSVLPYHRVAHRLTENRLLAIVARSSGNLSWDWKWLHRLSPDLRGKIYEQVKTGWRDAQNALPEEFVALLPLPYRHDEARRNLALPAFAARPTDRIRYAAYLPWSEALPLLNTFLQSAEAEIRGAALLALATCTLYERDHLPDVLAMMRARKNEQDPVRALMMQGLAKMPGSAWSAEHLALLGEIVQDGLNASDLSAATANSIEHMIMKLLRLQPDWSATWLAHLVQQRGTFGHYRFEAFSDADIQGMIPALTPVLHAWEVRERQTYLIHFAQRLGKRLKIFTPLLDILAGLVTQQTQGWTSVQALALLEDAQPERFKTFVVSLLKKDASWVTQQVVYAYLHRRRQDLLTPYLGQTAFKGRFSTGKTRFILPLTGGFFRWTPSQQHIFAGVLGQVTADTLRDAPALIMVIRQLAEMTYLPPVRLIELADSKLQVVRDTALRALGTLDAGQGIPTLLATMNDDRARIAIYALRGAVLEMPPDAAVALLRTMPLDKVTVAKEVVRLFGELKTDAAYHELLAFARQTLHRDIQVALMRALWDFLERDDTWPVLENAVQSGDVSLANIVARTPVERASPDVQRRLVHVLTLLMQHPDASVRVATLARCEQLPVTDSERALAPLFMRAMSSPLMDEMQAASSAIMATYARQDTDLLGQTVRTLLPRRRALLHLVNALLQMMHSHRAYLVDAARAMLDAMLADPVTAGMRIRLAIAALPWDDVTAMLLRLAEARELHADALVEAEKAFFGARNRTDVDGLAQVELTLAASDDRYVRRLALAALEAQSQPPRGWTSERLARLQQYRGDSAALVASAAQFIFPAEEEGELYYP